MEHAVKKVPPFRYFSKVITDGTGFYEENRMEQTSQNGRKLLGSQIEELILSYIRTTPLQIGDKLPNEFELAEMFRVGRSTIREAVKALVIKGVLEVRRGAGTFVASTTVMENDPLGLGKLDDKYKLAMELFEVRLMLEPEIAAKAAEYATEDDIKELTRLCNETEALYLSDQDHLPKDIEFHTYIAKCSHNRVVSSLLPIINSAITTFVNLTYRTLMSETIATHRAVTEAIAEHDSIGARCAMIMHLTYNRQELKRQWKQRILEETSDN